MNKHLSNKLRAISFLLSILVVVCHAQNLTLNLGSGTFTATKGFNWFIQEILSQGIAKIASPFFFIIAGFTFFLNLKSDKLFNFFKKFKRRFKTLIIPYLIWSLAGVLLYFLLQSIPLSKNFFTNQIIANLSFKELLSIIFINPIPYQLWFIRDLTVLIILSPVLYKLIKHFGILTLSIFFLLWILDINCILFSNRAILFFSFGALFSIKNIDINEYEFKKHCPVFFFAWIFLIVTKTYLSYMDFENKLLLNLIHNLSVLVGIFSVWTSYDYLFEQKDISKTKVFHFFKYGFFVYVFHEPFLTIIKKGLYFIFGFSELSSFLIYIIAPTTAIFIGITIGYYMKKITPKIYDIISGGR